MVELGWLIVEKRLEVFDFSKFLKNDFLTYLITGQNEIDYV